MEGGALLIGDRVQWIVTLIQSTVDLNNLACYIRGCI